MKNAFTRYLSVILTVIMVIAIIPLSVHADNGYVIGDVIEIGSYPQKLVTEENLIGTLNAINANWESYGYYLNAETSDYMQYKDVTYNGTKYRGVIFSSYKAFSANNSANSMNSCQDDNGYKLNTVYWFKYTPLKWRILDAGTGLVLCQSIIDAQPYANICTRVNGESYNSEGEYANDYSTSNIRTWLNDDFYNTAFTPSQANIINNTLITNTGLVAKYTSDASNDKVFLLSRNEILNSAYGFSSLYNKYDISRQCVGTDYARIQGLYVYASGSHKDNSHWLLRTSGNNSDSSCFVLGDGYVYSDGNVSCSYYGIRPAITVNLEELENPYTDLNGDSWYGSAALWCSANGYIQGTSAKTFSPNADLTRAMYITILARIAGADLSNYSYTGIFKDIPQNSWYTNAVEWAKAEAITAGTSNNTFSPGSTVTREQLAAFFFSYAKKSGYDTSKYADLSKYEDSNRISPWATESMQWACGEGIISGTGSTALSPKANATRAQAAVMFKNFAINH